MIRLLAPEDSALWKGIRLEALSSHPAAYNGSFEEESQKNDTQWARDLESSHVFAYLSEDRAAGVAGYYLPGQKKKLHQGVVFTVFVRPEHRGKGVTEWLFGALELHARAQGVEQLHLGVGTYNTPAVRCYKRHGYVVYGTEPRTLKLNGEYIDEYLMVKFL